MKESWPEDNYQGTFKKTNSDGSVYTGDFVGQNMHGYGEMIYKDGSEYQGTWKDNKRDGQGTYKDFPLGYQYYGSWKED